MDFYRHRGRGLAGGPDPEEREGRSTRGGSAGGDAKCGVAVREFGYDRCVDYTSAKTAEELARLVRSAAPEGLDAYFECVGGDHLKAAVQNLRMHGRIVVCGTISMHARTTAKERDMALPGSDVVHKQLLMEGFVCFDCQDWLAGKRGTFLRDMSAWYRAGLVKSAEKEFHGAEQWPDAFVALFSQVCICSAGGEHRRVTDVRRLTLRQPGRRPLGKGGGAGVTLSHTEHHSGGLMCTSRLERGERHSPFFCQHSQGSVVS